MNTLKQLQEKGEAELNFYSKSPAQYEKDFYDRYGQYIDKSNLYAESGKPPSVSILGFINQQTTLAFEAGKTEATAMVLKEIDHDSNHFCKKYGEQFKECARCYIERILQAKQ